MGHQENKVRQNSYMLSKLETDRMMRMITDLLNIAYGPNRLELDKEFVNMNELRVKHIANRFDMVLSSDNIVKKGTNIFNGYLQLEIYGLKLIRLSAMLDNIINNAIKYSQTSRIIVRLMKLAADLIVV